MRAAAPARFKHLDSRDLSSSPPPLLLLRSFCSAPARDTEWGRFATRSKLASGASPIIPRDERARMRGVAAINAAIETPAPRSDIRRAPVRAIRTNGSSAGGAREAGKDKFHAMHRGGEIWRAACIPRGALSEFQSCLAPCKRGDRPDPAGTVTLGPPGTSPP